MKCPKCNLKISKKDKKCPFCETKIRYIKDNIEKLPEIIDEPNKITAEENLDTQPKLNIKEIPLKVKPITSPKPVKKEKKKNIPKTKAELKKEREEKEKKLKFYSNLKIILVVLLLIINILLITKTIIDLETEPVEKEKQTIPIKHAKSTIIGTWRSSTNGLFIFQDNELFYWYDSYQDQQDNYYSGTYNYKKGKEALEEMGYTEDEFKKTFGEGISVDNVYSMNMIPNLSVQKGMNNTERDIKENESWWYILIVKDEQTAIAYNKTLDLRYSLIKN